MGQTGSEMKLEEALVLFGPTYLTSAVGRVESVTFELIVVTHRQDKRGFWSRCVQAS